MPESPRRRLLAAAVAATTVAALTFTGGTAASAAPQESFPGSVPSWAKTAKAVSDAPASAEVEGEIYFSLRHAARAEALAKAVSTPGSGRYGETVTPATWIKHFSPAKADYAAVVGFLKGAGLRITSTPKSRLFVVFRGTAAAMEAALGADLQVFRHGGHLVIASAKAPVLPDSLSRGVLGVRVDQSRLLTRPTTVTPSASAARAAVPADSTPVELKAPCSRYYGQHKVTVPEAYGSTRQPTELCGYVGKQLRSAYSVPKSLTGRGQQVAIIDAYASPTIVQDVNTFSGKHDQARLATYSQITPKRSYDVTACGGRAGWQTEQTLDVQAVHNIAPAARILYVGAFNCGGGIDAALSTILDGRLATIVSNSYGGLGEVPVDVVLGEQNQQLQAAAEGIGLYYASGDNGDTAALTGTAQPSYFATSPWVTGVGGTTLGIAKDGSVALETGWGSAVAPIVRDSDTGTIGYGGDLPGEFVFGAGGGTSTVFDQPSYQAGIVPNDLANGHRVAPDLSADADPFTGQLIGVRPLHDKTGRSGKYEEFAVGGTSLATPLVAAQIALVQQRSGRSFGFLNPVLYTASKPLANFDAAPSVLRDVRAVQSAFVTTSTSSGISYLVTNDVDTSLQTRDGYDEVTGIGSLVLGER